MLPAWPSISPEPNNPSSDVKLKLLCPIDQPRFSVGSCTFCRSYATKSSWTNCGSTSKTIPSSSKPLNLLRWAWLLRLFCPTGQTVCKVSTTSPGLTRPLALPLALPSQKQRTCQNNRAGQNNGSAGTTVRHKSRNRRSVLLRCLSHYASEQGARNSRQASDRASNRAVNKSAGLASKMQEPPYGGIGS
jgi:hypothetical protein